MKQTSWPYCRSKAESELVARSYQELGAPVVSVMPAAVWGPHDPHFGEGVTRATNVLKRRYPIVMRGGMHIADVRDVAAVLAAVMTPGQGARSYLVAGHYISFPDLIRTLADLSGRRIPLRDLPGVVPGRVRPHGRLRTAASQGATAVGRRGDLGPELRGPVRRLEDAKRNSGSSPAPCGNTWPTPSGGWSRSAASVRARRDALPNPRRLRYHAPIANFDSIVSSRRRGMRRVVAAEYVTVDGVMQDPGGVGEIEEGGWSNPYFDADLAKYQSDQLFASDALLLGRVTYEGFAAAWPSMEESEGSSPSG